MKITDMELLNFRNLQKQSIALSDGINILVGNNGEGKTNFLESIYFSATGRSHRTASNRELIEFSAEFAHMRTSIEGYYKEQVDMHILKNGKTGARLNNLPLKKLGDLFGIIHVVLFAPEDLSLIKEGPGVRRRFLDLELCQLSPVYYKDLQQYYKVIQQRNALLKQLKKNIKKESDALFLWDEQLLYYGKRIITRREEFIHSLGSLAAEMHKFISGEKLRIHYMPSTTTDDFDKKLMDSRDKDIYYGSTSVGIHRDDMQFFIEEKDARTFASQGEVRTTALALKMAQLTLIKEIRRKNAVLLLDDVFSELDLLRQSALLSIAKENQTIITCTGVESILEKSKGKASFFSVENGLISEI